MIWHPPIDWTAPFCLYADCAVRYDGRAYSTLGPGRYLILWKADGSFLVHGGILSNACNYQGPGSTITVEGNLIICQNKTERITVTINKLLHYYHPHDWSSERPKVGRTEKELVAKIYDNWPLFFPGIWKDVELEYQTPLGPIDICGIGADCYVVVEVKRRKATVKDVTQLRRYVEQFSNAIGYLAAPAIGEKAQRYLEEQGLRWLAVDFDPVSPTIR